MRPPLLFALALVAALLLVVAAWQVSGHRARREAARARTVEAVLRAVRDSLAELRSCGPGRGTARPALAFATEYDLQALAQRGLADPALRLREDLCRHPELIPFRGTRGGVMGFYDTTAFCLLDDRWVFARFDDGHVAGAGLFEFRVLPGGRIDWKRIAARLDE